MAILDESLSICRGRLGDIAESLTVERIVVGLFFSGVKLSDGSAGICYTPIKEIPRAVCCPSSAGRIFDPLGYKGMSAVDVAGQTRSSEPIKRAVAIAALNALTCACWNRDLFGDCRMATGLDAQDAAEIKPADRVVVIGALTPTMRMLKERGGDWSVVEMDRNTLKGEELNHFVPADNSAETIGRADVLVVTGTTMVNAGLEAILDQADPKARIVVLGPTASMTPEPLFERGVDLVGGIWIKQPDQLLDVLSAGGSGYHFFDRSAERVVLRPGA